MWQDFLSGLTLSAITGALYALATCFRPGELEPWDDAWDLLVLVGIMLSVSGFFAEFLGSRLSRSLREDMAEIDERSRRFDESIRARALRLNAHALAPLGCMTASDASPNRVAKVIPFRARRGISGEQRSRT